METKIIEISNEHFEWDLDEDGKLVKKILSDKIITKLVKVTYDDDGKEVNREAYIEPEELEIDTSKISDKKLLELKERLDKL